MGYEVIRLLIMNISKSVLLILAILIFKFLSAQILYTDLQPDSIMHFGSFPTSTKDYFFDVNSNNTNDLKIRFARNWGLSSIRVIPLNNAEIIYKQSTNYLDTLSINYQIDSSCLWINSYLYMVDNAGYDTMGTWATTINKFAGFRLKINSKFIYGWIRLKNKYTVCDFAVNLKYNEPITTGDGMPYIAENLKISDVSDYKDSRDVKIEFNVPLNEFLISAYRIIAVKSSEASYFTVDSANSAQPQNYTEVPAIGEDYVLTLPPEKNDFNGDPITEFIPYKVFILSIANGIDTSLNLLSQPSNTLILTSPAEQVSNLQAETMYLGGSVYKIHITFDKVSAENLINSYRLIFVKETQSIGFNLDSANNVNENYCTVIQPTGNNCSFTDFAQSFKDKKWRCAGQRRIEYKAFVLTVSDTINTNVNALSAPSNIIKMTVPVMFATSVIAEDIGILGSEVDLQVSFNKSMNESGILEYRLIAVRLSDTAVLNPDSLLDLENTHFVSIQPTGNDILTIFNAGILDKDGQPILEEIPYKVYVLSVANLITADESKLSNPSNIITLSTPDYLKAGQISGNNIIYTNLVPDGFLTACKSTVTYNLDLNNDNVDDFIISATHESSPMLTIGYSSVEALNNNSVSVIPSSNFPDTLSLNCMINNDLYWHQGLSNVNYYFYNELPGGDYCWGIWAGLTDKYMGLQLIVGQDEYYGWIGITIGYTSFTIRDYAFINDSTGSNKSNFEHDLIIYPNPAKNKILIENTYFSILFVILRDIKGAPLIYEKLQQGNNEINLENLASGYYIITILDTNNKVISSKKIVKP